jgi:hypothetical protein
MRRNFAIGIALAIVLSLPMLSSAQAPAGRGRGAAPAAAKPAPPAAPAPRFKDGTINLDAVPGQKGFWNAFNGQLVGKTGNALPTNLEIAEVPFRPWAKALYDFRKIRNGLDDPHSRCQPAGGLRFWNAPNGTEFIQDPDHNRILLIDGENRDWKRIAMEPGRKHPSVDDLNPSYFGDAIGHWEGDTLVVDTVGFNEKFWAFRNGMPHTRFLHLSTLHPRRYEQNQMRVTIDDKGAYTAPFSGGWYQLAVDQLRRHAERRDPQYLCIDNERDSSRFERGTE